MQRVHGFNTTATEMAEIAKKMKAIERGKSQKKKMDDLQAVFMRRRLLPEIEKDRKRTESDEESDEKS